MLEMAGSTDKGLVRERNEDAIKLIPEQGLAILSDGMGGHLAGDVASRMAIDIIAEKIGNDGFKPGEPFPLDVRNLLKSSLSAANSSIRAVARSRPECHGMGATVVVCIVSDQVLISHLGDSRGYLFADDRLTQLTEDHTLAQQYLNSGMINEKEARSWSGRNLLVKGLGIEAHVDPDISINELNQGMICLLCSDGLTDVVSDSAIAQCLRTATDDLDLTARLLIDKAIDNGGPDNISVILIRAANPHSSPANTGHE
jgi:serine/threonine protein phosphatase PrpC